LSGDELDTSGFTPYESGGKIQMVENTFVNLDHLEGETVKIQGTDVDDNTIEYDEEVVTDGIVSLMELSPHAHNFVRKAIIGLAFRSTLSPMRLDITRPIGTTHGSIAKIHKLIVSFLNTLGDVQAGDSLSNLVDIVFDSTTSLNTGDVEVPLDGGYDTDDTILISTNSPFPCTIRAIIPRKEKTGQ
jgi:hypothetical protein